MSAEQACSQVVRLCLCLYLQQEAPRLVPTEALLSQARMPVQPTHLSEQGGSSWGFLPGSWLYSAGIHYCLYQVDLGLVLLGIVM